MMRFLLAAVCVLVSLCVVSPAFAQTPDSYQLRFYAPGASQPMQAGETFPASAVTCNQTPPSPSSVRTVNPNRVTWNDRLNTGKICVYTPPSTSMLFSVPVGNYEGTLTAINAAGASAESTRAPFSRIDVQPAPTGLEFIRLQ